jgi:hypothetical protein
MLRRGRGIPIATGNAVNGQDAIFDLEETLDEQSGVVHAPNAQSILPWTVLESDSGFTKRSGLDEVTLDERGIATGIACHKGNDTGQMAQ